MSRQGSRDYRRRYEMSEGTTGHSPTYAPPRRSPTLDQPAISTLRANAALSPWLSPSLLQRYCLQPRPPGNPTVSSRIQSHGPRPSRPKELRRIPGGTAIGGPSDDPREGGCLDSLTGRVKRGSLSRLKQENLTEGMSVAMCKRCRSDPGNVLWHSHENPFY